MRDLVITGRPARPTLFFLALAAALGAACNANNQVATSTTGNPGGTAGNGGTGNTGNGGGDGGIGGFDPVGGSQTGSGGAVMACKVLDDDAQNAPTCEEKAPADAFAPSVQWEWTAPPADPSASLIGSFSTPLVGNFTDDNGDGAIDLCDTPDVLVSAVHTFEFAGLGLNAAGYIYMLAGDTGLEELKFPVLIDTFVYPAFGDIDGDTYPDLVTADKDGHLMAFKHDGTVKWTSPAVAGYRTTFASAQCAAIALYDIDANGTPEILFGWEVFDNQGNKLFGDPTNAAEFDGQYWCVTPTAADLDGDGKLELYVAADEQREIKRYTYDATKKEWKGELIGRIDESSITWNITAGKF